MEVKTYLTFRPRVARVVRYADLLTLSLGLVSMVCSAANPPTVVVQWNNAALQGDRDSSFGPPMIARALAMVHTCMYDAWAAYDAKAIGTQLGGTLRRPASERTLANKQQAISYGAYRALVDLFAFDKPLFDALMTSLGYDPSDNSNDITTPTGIGNVACAAVLNFRHTDGSNQLGDLHPGPIRITPAMFRSIRPAVFRSIPRWYLIPTTGNRCNTTMRAEISSPRNLWERNGSRLCRSP